MSRLLYLITDGGRLRLQNKLLYTLQSIVSVAGESISAIQLREQVVGGDYAQATDAELLELARAFHEVCNPAGVKVLINSRVELVERAGVEGVHLGVNSASVLDARGMLGENRTIGYSAHSVEEALDAEEQGADYVLLSPIFAPFSKSSTREPLGINALADAVSKLNISLFALGGISPARAAECCRAGATGVAGINYGFGAESPQRELKELLTELEALL